MRPNQYISFLPTQKIYRFTKQSKNKKYIRYFKKLDDAIVARDDYLNYGIETPLGRKRQINKEYGKQAINATHDIKLSKTEKIEFTMFNRDQKDWVEKQRGDVWEYHYEPGTKIPDEVLKYQIVKKGDEPITNID